MFQQYISFQFNKNRSTAPKTIKNRKTDKGK